MGKYFQDSIHGNIKLSELAVSIIDTYEYQRLKNIKQLGSVFYVFHTASHTRFEHSIGVAYLGRLMIEKIRINHKELNITYSDILNVEIAGLCHDLGHGPFSHLFDSFLEKVFPNNKLNKHEERSCLLLELIVKKYNLEISDNDLNEIKNMINPDNTKKNNFKYQIINNKINGIDVDKIDYLIRDSYYIGTNFGINFFRFLDNFKVINNEIYFLEKELFNIYELFNIRFRFHKQIYGHKVVRKIDAMILDIFYLLYKSNSNYIKMSNILENNLEFFCLFTDNILNIVEFVSKNIEINNKSINDAYKIIKRINNRDLYNIIKKPDNIKSLEKEYLSNHYSISNVINGYIIENHPLWFVKIYNKDGIVSFNDRKLMISELIGNNFYENYFIIFKKN